MRFHCTNCNAYRDPQSLDYETGLCGDCQEKGVVVAMPSHQGSMRLGTVLVFKADATMGEVERAMESIAHLVQGTPKVRPFNEDHGSPVWYIP